MKNRAKLPQPKFRKGFDPAKSRASLCERRHKLEADARKSALSAALKYYGFELSPGKEGVATLRKLVFGNWLQAHAFTERFEPLEMIGE